MKKGLLNCLRPPVKMVNNFLKSFVSMVAHNYCSVNPQIKLCVKVLLFPLINMDITFAYQKKRSEFGRQCLFADKGPELIDNFPSDFKLFKRYIFKDPFDRPTQSTSIQAEHYLNTMRAEFANGCMNHQEGGWPKDVNILDEEQTKRYKRKVEKEESWYTVMMQLFKGMENCILQNNAVNIYQHYYSDVEPMPVVQSSSARTVNVYRDPSNPIRPITHISWSPDNQTKLAVSYCNLNYQSYVPNETTHSYIWEVENPNSPLITFKPDNPIVCLEYNQKDPNLLVSGQKNGQVAVWDIRKGYDPVDLSVIENSFMDPVHSILWINSKTGTEFFSSSTDGQVKWWDTRKMTTPTDTLILEYAKDEDQRLSNAIGASVLEYESTIPTRFMVGTETGLVISCNRKGKTALEKMTNKFACHLGPVLALQRNPAFVKNFLTIGDWTAKIWSEDCKESCIMWTSFHRARLLDGAWSPTRLSVFFTTRSDGKLDVWDILQQQKQACLGVKVCDEPLTCLRTHDMGQLVAVGNKSGTTYLVQFSENLSTSNKNDKMLLTAMFDRENRREKILEARNREIRLKRKTKATLQQEQLDDGELSRIAQAAMGDFYDSFVEECEKQFYKSISPQKKTEVEEVKGEEEQEVVFEPEPEPEPEQIPEPVVAKEKGEKGKEVKGKEVKEKKGKGK